MHQFNIFLLAIYIHRIIRHIFIRTIRSTTLD